MTLSTLRSWTTNSVIPFLCRLLVFHTQLRSEFLRLCLTKYNVAKVFIYLFIFGHSNGSLTCITQDVKLTVCGYPGRIHWTISEQMGCRRNISQDLLVPKFVCMTQSIVNVTLSCWRYPNVTAETEEFLTSRISPTASVPHILFLWRLNSCVVRCPSHQTIWLSVSEVIEICAAYRWLYYCKMQRLTAACQAFKWLSDEDRVAHSWPPASTECFTVPQGQTLLPAAPCEVMRQMGHDASYTCWTGMAVLLWQS